MFWTSDTHGGSGEPLAVHARIGGIYVGVIENGVSQVVSDKVWEYGRKLVAGGPPKPVKFSK